MKAAPVAVPAQDFALIRAHQPAAVMLDAIPAQGPAMGRATQTVATAVQDALAVPIRAVNNAQEVAATHALGVPVSVPHLAGAIAPETVLDVLQHALDHAVETATQIVMLCAAVVVAAAVDLGVLQAAQAGAMAANLLAEVLAMAPVLDGAIPALDAILDVQRSAMQAAPTNVAQAVWGAAEDSVPDATGAPDAVPADVHPGVAAHVLEAVQADAVGPAEGAEEPAPLAALGCVIPLALAVATRRVRHVARTARRGVTRLVAVRALDALGAVRPAIPAAIPLALFHAEEIAPEAVAHRVPAVPVDAARPAARIVAQIALVHVLRSVSALRHLRSDKENLL